MIISPYNLVEWQGTDATTAETFVHEIGHVMGMRHDQDMKHKKRCFKKGDNH